MDLLQLQSDPAEFRSALLIDTDGGPKPLADVMDPWQAKDFSALDAGWKRAVFGKSRRAKRQRGWLERGRGHSKTADLAVMVSWALFASRRVLSGIAAAGDQDQARLLRDAIGRLLYINPWLSSLLEVQANRVVNKRTSSQMDVISSDAPTSYGLTPDFVIADEVVHWKKRDLWDSLLSSSAKRATCMLVVITNAGLSDDWQHQTREAVRTDPRWYFSRLDGPVASWISPATLDEQERLLPGVAYRRLWLNEWTSGGGDALTPEDIDAAFRPGLQPQTHSQPGFEYVAGMDLGVSRDASAIVVLGVRRGREGHGRIRLAAKRKWLPAKGSKVNLQQVEDECRLLQDRFALKQVRFDPWQAQHMASRLQSAGMGRMVSGMEVYKRASLSMVEVPQTGANLQKMATTVIEAFNDRRVDCFDDADLRRDLRRMRVEERSYGFRLVSPRDEHGHGDVGSAFCLAMLAATELAAKKKVQVQILGAGRGHNNIAALNEHERRVAAMPDDPAHVPPGWTDLMRQCGRLRNF